MSLASCLTLIESVKDRRVLFLGETIEDVYHYVSPLGRPVKELILSVQLTQTKVYRGGIVAAAAHASDFCSVSIETDRQLTKERWVEGAHKRKLFQCYTRCEVLPIIEQALQSDMDAIAVIDYGHGMLDGKSWLHPGIRYLALNVQTNSANYGYNLATKYERADYLVVDETEARLSTGNQLGVLTDSIPRLRQIASKGVITLGVLGAVGWDGEHIARCPALTSSIVDTLGAGDAFFAITAPMAEHGSIEDLLLIGNAAGALKAQILGHSASVTKPALIEYLKAKCA